jgi:hypothetical protein
MTAPALVSVLAAIVLLAQVSAAPVPSPAPEPVSAASNGRTRTLADVARERKLGKKGVSGGTLSVAGASGMPTVAAGGVEKPATDADARLARAIKDGAWVERNIHWNENIKQNARSEWDAAAENCRKTPGCTPVYRDNVTVGGVKPLRTGYEVMRDEVKRNGNYDSVEPLSH